MFIHVLEIIMKNVYTYTGDNNEQMFIHGDGVERGYPLTLKKPSKIAADDTFISLFISFEE